MKGLWAEDQPVGENSVCKSPGVRGGISLCGWGGEGEEEEGGGLTLWDLEPLGKWVLFFTPKAGFQSFSCHGPLSPLPVRSPQNGVLKNRKHRGLQRKPHTLARIHEDFVPFVYIFT